MAVKILVFLLLAICFCSSLALSSQIYQGKWKLLKRSIGISAMHMALLPNDRIITFDRSDFGPSNITLPQGKCTKDLHTTDCYAHAVEFDPATRNIRPLTILTDTWCSSGALSPEGVLVQSGGYRLGELVVRYLKPCLDCDWEEDPNGLMSPRWYASNQILPNGKIIVVGGRFQFSYEFIPKTSVSDSKLYQLPFLKETRRSPQIPNNLYPFLHLSTDGNLFVFANDRAILLDYTRNRVVRNYPVLPGGISRNYPSTGSSVLLPVTLSTNSRTTPDAEILICGGTLPDSNKNADAGVFVPASKSCGRLKITSENPNWVMEEMPFNRVMGDMILLPTGDVLVINGAAKGTAGWGVAREPVLNPVLYRTIPCNGVEINKFEILSPSTIPRMYHSTAHLLSDGRVLVGGSNPNINYNFSTIFPTELSLEAFYPPYLLMSNKSRPLITSIKPGVLLEYNQNISIEFVLGAGDNHDHAHVGDNIYVTMVAPSFTTHSFAMNQRLLILALDGPVRKIGSWNHAVRGHAPASGAVAPPGHYQLFVVHEGIPSKAMWVKIM
ncbi:hypothetical protein Ddye_002966 [Dipteronia dyeriana]|uniref:Galactose oxidase n=1 Tax=Dipteronia dyeriana TaxID=168575 RepID=A0AAE0CUU4_9ROSI|nr:hypothetical protein Ddye_002966 [Dipteronia dyeriana]